VFGGCVFGCVGLCSFLNLSCLLWVLFCYVFFLCLKGWWWFLLFGFSFLFVCLWVLCVVVGLLVKFFVGFVGILMFVAVFCVFWFYLFHALFRGSRKVFMCPLNLIGALNVH